MPSTVRRKKDMMQRVLSLSLSSSQGIFFCCCCVMFAMSCISPISPIPNNCNDFLATSSSSSSSSSMTLLPSVMAFSTVATTTRHNKKRISTFANTPTTSTSTTYLGVLTTPPPPPSSSSSTTITSPKQKKQGEEENEQNEQNDHCDPLHWEIAPTAFHPEPRPLTPDLRHALQTKTHPKEHDDDKASGLGRGIFITADWRDAWGTYQSPPEDPNLIDPSTGYADYEISDIEGTLPEDLVGTLYRNQPGKFGVAGERVQHILDGDALLYKMTFPPPSSLSSSPSRKIHYTSRFIQTKEFQEEQEAGKFLYRGVFGSGPTNDFFDKNRQKDGLNTDPIKPSLLARVFGSAGKTNIKNAANTQVIAWGGKLLAFFESALPYAIDPDTLKTLGEDTLDGVLKEGLPVKLGGNLMPSGMEPDFLGGAAHTAHPNVCPKTGNLIGWHWRQVVTDQSLEMTFTEWDEDFGQLASRTFEIPGCELAPHDMAITENCIIMNINALEMDQLSFMLGVTGPAASLGMDGRAPVKTWVFPRPTAKNQFEPYCVKSPACFTIHFSHAYEDEETGNLVAFFSGWPPSDSKDFLGSWGGYAPVFDKIAPTFCWRMEIDPVQKECVSLDIAPGASNMCVEHLLVHPNFNIRTAQNVYGTASNAIGDSTAPAGYAKLKVETGSTLKMKEGEFNEDVDAYWFGTRYFTTEPLIVPKQGGDPDSETDAYLLGIVQDIAKDRSFLAIFDLERDLKEGPVCRVYLKSNLPHGLHGCFVPGEEGAAKSSIFC